MDPEKKAALDRAMRRERLRIVVVPGLIVLVIVGLGAFFFMPRERLGPVSGTIDRFVARPKDVTSQSVVLVTLSDGQMIRIRPVRGDNSLAPGGTICLERTRHPITRWYKFVRVPNARCEAGGI